MKSTAKTVSFRAESQKIAVLDNLAALQDRDRTYLLNEALDHYLELNEYHLEQIRAGIADAKAGRFVDHADVKRMAAKWRAAR